MTDDVKLIHYKDIEEEGVYQPVKWGDGNDDVDYSTVWQNMKLVVLATRGQTRDGKKIPCTEAGVVKLWYRQDDNLVLCTDGATKKDGTSVILPGYASLLYRKLEHVGFFVGLRLKE